MLPTLVAEFGELVDAIVAHLQPRDATALSMTCSQLRPVGATPAAAHWRRFAPALRAIRAIAYRIELRVRYRDLPEGFTIHRDTYHTSTRGHTVTYYNECASEPSRERLFAKRHSAHDTRTTYVTMGKRRCRVKRYSEHYQSIDVAWGLHTLTFAHVCSVIACRIINMLERDDLNAFAATNHLIRFYIRIQCRRTSGKKPRPTNRCG